MNKPHCDGRKETKQSQDSEGKKTKLSCKAKLHGPMTSYIKLIPFMMGNNPCNGNHVREDQMTALVGSSYKIKRATA